MFKNIGIALKKDQENGDSLFLDSLLPILSKYSEDIYAEVGSSLKADIVKELDFEDFVNTVYLLIVFGGDGTLFQNMSGLGGLQGNNDGTTRFFVPLYFWFSRNPGLALPMIALQYNDVEIRIKTNFGLAYDTTPTNNLWTDFIYLDTDERRRFVEGEHEYLIEQLQEQPMNTGNATTILNFNYPVKELIWCVDGTATDQVQTAIGSNDSTYVLKLNGHERFEARDFRYFSRVQIFDHHSGAGGLTQNAGAATGKFSDGIGVYSFALNPEEHQPSGTCNFSRIDSAEIVGSSSDCVATRIYAINYNVLRIMSGMGGLAYSN